MLQIYPDEAVEIVIQYAGPETNPDHMRFMLETELVDLTSAKHRWSWHWLANRGPMACSGRYASGI